MLLNILLISLSVRATLCSLGSSRPRANRAAVALTGHPRHLELPAVASSMFKTKLRTPDDCVVFALNNLFSLQPKDWSYISSAVSRAEGRSSAGDLLYALRIASVVPKITSLKSLGSRSLVCRCGAGGAGLDCVPPSKRKTEVETRIVQIFTWRTEFIFESLWKKHMQRFAEAKTTEAKSKIKAKLDAAFCEANGLVDMPGIPEVVAKWRAALNQISC